LTVDRSVLVIEHGDDCPPARVGAWLQAAGLPIRVLRGQRGASIPPSLDRLAGLAGLVVLGGQMGAYDDGDHPWLTSTKALLRAAIDAGLPTLAICLGHQLLAVACGGRVERAPAQQVGLTPVGLTEAGHRDPVLGPVTPGALALHWNHDLVVEPPPGAVVLARCAAGIQAMRLGSALGVQFHPEADPGNVRLWADADVTAGGLGAAEAARHLEALGQADAELSSTWQAMTLRFAATLAHSAVPEKRPPDEQEPATRR
jgi:GMP synthase (glutamine-hydrolysing)